ncbi:MULTISPECIES: LPXTG cell wall anchor domain-containing protein [Enterococcus]|uniref:LPXTG cell wall anchor domain-containing protein n=1 Tax=Enterococcus alishanensis TaxID=1303817 RepID=A0ABS6TDW6_9ENTE|nr:LPXTG cell wall anchor domain-containing protein [Enterococcus alishanensis]MBV7391100.1 LPXTG cell wall anchor domain-containing protein [Enterococcus alishanensis]
MLPNTGEKIMSALPWIGGAIIVIAVLIYLYKSNKK